MTRGGLGGSVGLYQHETRGILLLLEHIKPSDARFPHALAGVLKSGLLEGFHRLGFHLHMDIYDQHKNEHLDKNSESSTEGNTDYTSRIVKGPFELGEESLLA